MSLVAKLGTKLRVTKLLLNFTKLLFEKANNIITISGLVNEIEEFSLVTPLRGS